MPAEPEAGTGQPVFLDHQATTPLDPRVLDAMLPFFKDRFGNPHSTTNRPGLAARAALTAARAEIGTLIGVAGETILLTSGGTEANNQAILGLPAAAGRDRLAISAFEHPSVSEAARRSGLTVDILPVTADGFVNLEAAARLIGPRTRLVSVMAANNEIGTIQPLAGIAALARSAGALMHSDASQAVAGMALDAPALGLDLVTLCAHKIYGPAGIGALYIRPAPPLGLQPLLHGGSQQGALRPGTVPVALAAGFGEAARLMRLEGPGEWPRLAALRDRLLTRLSGALEGVSVNGGVAPRLPGNLNLTIAGIDAEILLLELMDTVSASTGSACADAAGKPSPSLKAIGLDAARISVSLRLGIGRFTREADIDRAADALIGAIKKQRSPLATL
ncbi:cysteine desulfurase family protein [Radicibacter daui]|uniref:cysteine desulfurase family protein n=1 Tax=Radicibacter daui TaxID=3064829 RepID=UPI004046AF54